MLWQVVILNNHPVSLVIEFINHHYLIKNIIMDLIHQLIGTGKELTWLQMSVRAFIFFFITLVYIRIAGMRTFGKKSSIDMIIVIVLGSVIARGIAGASGFCATVASSFVLVIVHRAVAWLTLRSKFVEKLIKGKKILLYYNSEFHKANMEKTGISQHDFFASFRLTTQSDSTNKLLEAYMETNGELSFVLRETPGQAVES